MNDTIQQLFDRKSVRAFTDEPITEEERRLILEAAIQAPTAENMSLYSILEVRDPQLKAALAKNCGGQSFIAKAPLVLVFLADWQKWADLSAHYGKKVGPLSEIKLFLGMEDCTIAAQNAVVAAWSMGIGSCYIGNILEHVEDNRMLLNLPEHVLPFSMLVLGRPNQQQKDRKKPTRFTLEEMVHVDRYEPMGEDKLVECFSRHAGGKTGDELERWAASYTNRKFFAETTDEITRSSRAMLDLWTGKEDGLPQEE